MPRTRGPYPEEFRRQMVELVRTGRTLEELGREFEPCGETIRNWVKHTVDDLAAVAHALNTRPRETLGWETPAEALHQFLRTNHNGSAATTG